MLKPTHFIVSPMYPSQKKMLMEQPHQEHTEQRAEIHNKLLTQFNLGAQVITQSPAVRHQKRRRMSELTPIRLPAIREESLSPLCPSTRIQLQPNVDSVQVLQPLKTLVSNPPPTKPGSSFRSAPIAGSVSGLRLSSPPDKGVATGNVAAGSHSPAPDRAVALRPWQVCVLQTLSR